MGNHSIEDDGILTLREAGPKLSVSYGILEQCLKRGLYNDIPVLVQRRSKAGGRSGLLGRAWVAEERLPALLERTWEWVLYERRGSSAFYGPWVPTEAVQRWLKAQVAKRAHAARDEVNPAIMTSLARDLEIDPRRLYAWLTSQYTHIPYAVLEDALWAYSCMKPEDICPRELMVISKPPKNRKETA